MWSVGSVWPLERVSHSCEPMVLLYEPGAVPILVSLYHGMELVSGTPPLWRPILVSPAFGTELVSGWIPPFYFSLPRERTRPLGEDVRGSSDLEILPSHLKTN